MALSNSKRICIFPCRVDILHLADDVECELQRGKIAGTLFGILVIVLFGLAEYRIIVGIVIYY